MELQTFELGTHPASAWRWPFSETFQLLYNQGLPGLHIVSLLNLKLRLGDSGLALEVVGVGRAPLTSFAFVVWFFITNLSRPIIFKF